VKTMRQSDSAPADRRFSSMRTETSCTSGAVSRGHGPDAGVCER